MSTKIFENGKTPILTSLTNTGGIDPAKTLTGSKTDVRVTKVANTNLEHPRKPSIKSGTRKLPTQKKFQLIARISNSKDTTTITDITTPPNYAPSVDHQQKPIDFVPQSIDCSTFAGALERANAGITPETTALQALQKRLAETTSAKSPQQQARVANAEQPQVVEDEISVCVVDETSEPKIQGSNPSLNPDPASSENTPSPTDKTEESKPKVKPLRLWSLPVRVLLKIFAASVAILYSISRLFRSPGTHI